jgi:hypothetical protein
LTVLIKNEKHPVLWDSVIVQKTLPNIRGVSYMIDQNSQNNQLPKELDSVFSELEMNRHLRQAGIKKSFGFSCAYLFRLVFCLIFQHKNWFSLLDSRKADKYPAKDTVYRFLNQSTFNWRRFLLLLSSFTIQKVGRITDQSRPKVFIIDDSAYNRNPSKAVELLARCFDHASLKMCFYKGFRMLTLGWSDGYTFMPVDFSLLSSKKTQINGISEQIDKRTCGYQRQKDALLSAPEQIPDMIKRALASGIEASYVLMDSGLHCHHLSKPS